MHVRLLVLASVSAVLLIAAVITVPIVVTRNQYERYPLEIIGHD